jgi:feruloyl esterase
MDNCVINTTSANLKQFIDRALTALEKWQEKKIAPQEIIASQMTNGSVTCTRPLCPYPQVAHYKGAGNTDQSENFVCRMP